MKNTSGIAQLLLRFALGVIFLMAVVDRLGWLGGPGANGVAWGDWKYFVDNTNTLVPFADRRVASVLSVLATVAETLFGICLVIGLKVRQVALGVTLLTGCFGLSMAVFVSISAPFSYPVFVFTASGPVLSALDRYRWSLDDYFARRRE